MENFYIDCKRADNKKLDFMREYFKARMGGRPVWVVGSAPDPIFPSIPSAFNICVNGSGFSLRKYRNLGADLTFLNHAIFRDESNYTKATHLVLENESLGDLILNTQTGEAKNYLRSRGFRFNEVFIINKYEKRVILGEVLGYDIFGWYRHFANVSNGVFMVAFALWCEASLVTMIGFSLENKHEYSPGTVLSPRDHVNEDMCFLKLAKSRDVSIECTSVLLP